MNEAIKRIMIFGRPGSGKSTFALKLHQMTSLPLYHLDKYFYTSNWAERDYSEFLRIQEELINQDRWIIDGNCTKSLEMRYQRAHLVLFFNYPLPLCYWRIIKRLLKPEKAIDDRAEGCSETIRWSLLRYMWTFKSRINQKLPKLKNKYPSIPCFEVKSDKDLQTLFTYLLNQINVNL